MASILSFVYLANAQSIRTPIRVLTTQTGLPQSFISGLVQDDDGFVWIGTLNGLARYDGRQFRTFRHQYQDTASIASNQLMHVSKDGQNRIWIEHKSGEIERLDTRTETLFRVASQPAFRRQPVRFLSRGWLIDAQGKLWGLTPDQGISVFDWRQQTHHQYARRTNKMPSDTVRGLLKDRRQQIWAVSLKGLSCFNSQTGYSRHVRFPAWLKFSIPPNRPREVIALHERSTGEIMWGNHHQLFFFNPATGLFRTQPLPTPLTRCVRWIQKSPDGPDYLEADKVVYRYTDAQGLTLVSTLNDYKIDDVRSFLIDQSGLIWLGTNAAGIYQVEVRAPVFASNPYQVNFHEDICRQLLGFSLIQSVDWPTTDPRFSRVSYVARSTYDPQHRLWLALRDQVGYYNPTSRQCTWLPPVPTVGSSANRALGIQGLRFGPDGQLWVAGHNGYIATFDSTHRQWVPFLPPEQIRQTISPHTIPLDLVVDEEALWLTTEDDGLLRIDRRTRQIRRIAQQKTPRSLPTNQLLGIQPDQTQPDLLWIGSFEGLICLNKKTLSCRVFSTSNGLPDNTIYALLPDRAGKLWLATNNGLCRFDTRSHQVRVIRAEDGLPGNEFNRFHQFELPNGQLAFGGVDGWTQFNPATPLDDPFQPPVVLTGLSVNNAPVQYSPGQGPLPEPIDHLQTLELPHDQNTLSVEFAGLEYNFPYKLSYRYRLSGHDPGWIQAGSLPRAIYTQLQPGRYRLLVNSTNTTGQWSRHVRTLAIVITPPWWQTWWAYVLYALLTAGVITAYIRYRLHRERLQQAVAMQQREADQLRIIDEMKTRFFTNITHELRTPLTLILSPIETLLDELSGTPYARRLSLVNRNARQLLSLINQLLDLAKLEAHVMKIDNRRGNPSEFIGEIIQSFSEQAIAKQITLRYQPDTVGDYWFDQDKLERIVTNLVANALKFTDAAGLVTVSLTTTEKGLLLTVADTGVGIPENDLPYIFNRFYQVNGRQAHGPDISLGSAPPVVALAPQPPDGTGIGLSLVQELVTLQNGKIDVSSQIGQGTTFRVSLPYPRANAVSGHYPPANAPVPPVENRLLMDAEPDSPLVLLVDDNPEIADFIANSLPDQYRIHRAIDGLDGLEKALLLMPDLVISDVLMPRLNGYELCRRLKADEQTNHIPIILLTAKATLSSQLEGLAQGADGYLTKPFHVQDLRLRVHNLLQQRWRQQAWIRRSLTDVTGDFILPDTNDAFLSRLYVQLDAQLDNSSLSVEQIAGQLELSRVQLHRKVKSLTGLATSDLIRNYRLRRAAQLLMQGFNSSETAYRVGFESPAYFAKCFRDVFRCSPIEFAQTQKKLS